jgi:hypothetical protein
MSSLIVDRVEGLRPSQTTLLGLVWFTGAGVAVMGVGGKGGPREWVLQMGYPCIAETSWTRRAHGDRAADMPMSSRTRGSTCRRTVSLPPVWPGTATSCLVWVRCAWADWFIVDSCWKPGPRKVLGCSEIVNGHTTSYAMQLRARISCLLGEDDSIKTYTFAGGRLGQPGSQRGLGLGTVLAVSEPSRVFTCLGYLTPLIQGKPCHPPSEQRWVRSSCIRRGRRVSHHA